MRLQGIPNVGEADLGTTPFDALRSVIAHEGVCVGIAPLEVVLLSDKHDGRPFPMRLEYVWLPASEPIALAAGRHCLAAEPLRRPQCGRAQHR